MPRRPTAAAAVAVATLCLLLAPALAGAAEYNLATDHDVDVPQRTVEQGGDTFTISAIARANPGETVSVTATAPDDADVTLYLYNDDRQIIDAREGTGRFTAEFTLANDSGAGYPAGTYAFVLQHDGTREAAHPLVVRGYAVDASAPARVERGESVRVRADVRKLRGPTKERVEVVVANDATDVRRTATPADDGHAATVDTDALPPGEYDVYATVRGPDEALGEQELLGLSDPSTLTVTAATETPTGTAAGGGGAGGATGTPAATATGRPSPTGTAAEPRGATRATTAGETTRVADVAPGRPGVTVRFDGPLRAVTFDAESAPPGRVAVERKAPPPAVTRQFDDVLATVAVSVPPALSTTPATLQFVVDAGDRDPTALRVVKVVDGGLRLLPTRAETAEAGVVVTADTPGFSTFAVVHAGEGTPPDGVVTPAGTVEPTTGTGSTHVFALVGLAALAVLVGARLRR